LVKGAIYGFLIGLALAIIFIPDTITRVEGNATTIYTLSIREYLFKLLRFAVIAGLATTIVVWIRDYYLGPRKSGEPGFLNGFVKSFVIVLAIIMLAFLGFTLIMHFISS